MKKKILIVEDETTILNILAERFTSEGFEVFSAENGKIGLELAFKNHPDIILLDIIMPVMDGMAMLDVIRKDVWGEHVHVILLTNLSDNEKVFTSNRNGVFDYLIKCNMTMDNIVQTVEEKLTKSS
jgi:DNA-binding response OmpR family regulator